MTHPIWVVVINGVAAHKYLGLELEDIMAQLKVDYGDNLEGVDKILFTYEQVRVSQLQQHLNKGKAANDEYI